MKIKASPCPPPPWTPPQTRVIVRKTDLQSENLIFQFYYLIISGTQTFGSQTPPPLPPS